MLKGLLYQAVYSPVGMPSCRRPPSGLGMLRHRSSSSTALPSIPGAPLLLFTRWHACSKIIAVSYVLEYALLPVQFFPPTPRTLAAPALAQLWDSHPHRFQVGAPPRMECLCQTPSGIRYTAVRISRRSYYRKPRISMEECAA